MKKKKKYIILIVVLVVVAILLIYFLLSLNTPLLTPVKRIQEQNSQLSNSTIRKINENLLNEITSLGINEDENLYLSDNDTYQNETYQGRFVSEEGYTYQFTIDCDTAEVDLIEIAKVQLAREALELDQGGFDPNER